MANEVYTPDGSWSSYPPHKHDTLNLPMECDLDEIYYFRVNHPDGFKPVSARLRQRGQTRFHCAHSGWRFGPAAWRVSPGRCAPGLPRYYLAVLAGSGLRLLARCNY